ncbi:hypothetical protein RIF25_09505 [Thermosynechococcaceae cyanobacterium BACA0444]|uniref:Uncharacterized protein n=1 Tax=Pseudocalidococcus azoricus BACA0444 TaxID=2918990 RepID=A0AAE4JYJ0_9CYAN|nr:hypothetical protein [Pseudocalidococcus azoricus]MDS3861044.1 hypothetical protein [Pseudocalidococcus azoricus BACA0444]
MKANLLSLIPPTLLTVLIAATAALRFYDATDFPPQFPPLTLRQWSFWAFLATLLVAMVDFGIKWYFANRGRYREAEIREQETERIKRSARRDMAILSFLVNPTDTNRERLEAICQEIEQSNLD